MSELELLNRISELQFVCVELHLYLNTNPEDENARADYLVYGKALVDSVKRYEAAYGPLMNFGHSPTDVGSYTNSPWPWESGR